MEQPKGMRRQVQKAETRALILESARALFSSQDYDKVTIRGVAAQAGIGLGTIYKHFPNKLSLLAAAFSDDLTTLHREAMATVPEDQPFQAQFIHITRRFFTFYTSRQSLSRAYLSRLFFYEKEWQDQIKAFDKTFAGNIAELIRTAQDRGDIRPEKDADVLALALMSNYFFVVANCFLQEKTDDPGQMAELLSTLVNQTLN